MGEGVRVWGVGYGAGWRWQKNEILFKSNFFQKKEEEIIDGYPWMGGEREGGRGRSGVALK